MKKKNFLRRELDRLEVRLTTEVPEDLFKVIVKVNNEEKRIEQEKSRATQRDKYYKLKYGEKYEHYHNNSETRRTGRSKVSPIDKSKWVVNISKRKLSPIEEKVLQKGSGFAIADKDIRYDEYVTAVQQASKSFCQSQSSSSF